jgi:hypothetical protein
VSSIDSGQSFPFMHSPVYNTTLWYPLGAWSFCSLPRFEPKFPEPALPDFIPLHCCVRTSCQQGFGSLWTLSPAGFAAVDSLEKDTGIEPARSSLEKRSKMVSQGLSRFQGT